MKILIATSNEAKIKKYSTILDELKIEHVTLKDLNINIDIEETGNTSKENSIIKVKEYYKIVNMPVLTDDCSLIIDKLPKEKQPGVFIRRKNGKRLTDEEMIELYSNELEKIGGESTGSFLIAIAIADEKGDIYTNECKHNRLFVSKPSIERTVGYPMNSIIYDKEAGKYLAENYEGKNIYKGNSFENDFKFIKSVLIDKKG